MKFALFIVVLAGLPPTTRAAETPPPARAEACEQITRVSDRDQCYRTLAASLIQEQHKRQDDGLVMLPRKEPAVSALCEKIVDPRHRDDCYGQLISYQLGQMHRRLGRDDKKTLEEGSPEVVAPHEATGVAKLPVRPGQGQSIDEKPGLRWYNEDTGEWMDGPPGADDVETGV